MNTAATADSLTDTHQAQAGERSFGQMLYDNRSLITGLGMMALVGSAGVMGFGLSLPFAVASGAVIGLYSALEDNPVMGVLKGCLYGIGVLAMAWGIENIALPVVDFTSGVLDSIGALGSTGTSCENSPTGYCPS